MVEQAHQDLMLPTVSNDLVRRTVDQVLFGTGKDKSVGAVAEALFVHRNHLSQTFSRGTGITLMEYIQRVKMYLARVLLWDLSLSVQEVAARLGYEDEEYFARLFREHAGVLPREYRKMIT